MNSPSLQTTFQAETHRESASSAPSFPHISLLALGFFKTNESNFKHFPPIGLRFELLVPKPSSLSKRIVQYWKF